MIKTTVGINGMSCQMCEAHVNDVIRRAFEVKKVSSSHKKKETVIISEEELSQERLKEAIAPTGYEVTSIHSEPYEKKGLFHFGK